MTLPKTMMVWAACAMLAGAARAADVTWVSSTGEQTWREMEAPRWEGQASRVPEVRVAVNRTYQTIDGFGGCFNELGWKALGKVTEADRARVLRGLFGDEGCAFTLGRLPIGASDFALEYYSLDDTPGDLALKDFSIQRDRRCLLPYVRAAMAVRPGLRCWGSAWSPPAWMKTNGNYSRGSLRWEPAVLKSYATYLAKWVESYRAEGINVYAVFTQNEPNVLNVYPTCEWSGAQLREFVADYLGPTLRQRKVEVELWLGTLNDGKVNDRTVTVLEDPTANAFITGVSFQYDAKDQVAAVASLYPDKKLMQSETECNEGKNSWADAERLYGLMKRYLESGVNSYFAWNMVLDDTGLSTWNWKQNALVTVNRETGQVTLNGEYYVMRHFSGFIKPGARRALTTGAWGDKIAFINPDGSVVMVIGNSAGREHEVTLAIGGGVPAGAMRVTLPAHSVNTFVVPAK